MRTDSKGKRQCQHETAVIQLWNSPPHKPAVESNTNRSVINKHTTRAVGIKASIQMDKSDKKDCAWPTDKSCTYGIDRSGDEPWYMLCLVYAKHMWRTLHTKGNKGLCRHYRKYLSFVNKVRCHELHPSHYVKTEWHSSDTNVHHVLWEGINSSNNHHHVMWKQNYTVLTFVFCKECKTTHLCGG